MSDEQLEVRRLNDRAIVDIARRACNAVFARHGHRLRSRATRGAGERACGVVAFEGPSLRGCLLLAAPLEAIARREPGAAVPVTDWLADLTRQIAERLVQTLADRGVTVTVTAPVVMPRGVRPPGKAAPSVFCLGFDTDDAFADEIDLGVATRWAPGAILDDPQRTRPLAPADRFATL